MIRMTIWTGIGLTLLYGLFAWLVSERLTVGCHEVLLSDREALVTLKNEGPAPVEKVLVVARVYEGDELVTSSTLVEKRNLPGQGKVQVRLPLAKPLAKGVDYRVVTHLQVAGLPPVSREFTSTVVKQTVMRWPPPRRPKVIEEPLQLRRAIQTINPRAEMGLL